MSLKIKTRFGTITSYDPDTCRGEITLDDGSIVVFHSTSFQSKLPTRFPVVGEKVEVQSQDGRLVGVRSAKSTDTRCICVNFYDSCSHEGQCEENVARSISDNYCDDCLMNAMAEVMV